MSDVTKVLLIEDQVSFSEAMRIALGTEAGIECVGVTTTVAGGVAFVEEHDVDVVLMDVDLPDVNGVEGTRRVKAVSPDISVVVLTGIADIDTLVRAVAAGADAFLAKDSGFDVILDAIRSRRTAGMDLDGATLDRLRTRLLDRGSMNGRVWDPALTDRERDVLSLLAAGVDPQAIARNLGITVHTCRGYVRNVLTKLGAHSQLEAVAVARRAQLLQEH